jgi:hypothetical protein
MKRPPFANATALVTGGAQRIGRAIALACADAGINVVVHYRSSRADARVLAAEIASRGVGAWAVGATLGTQASCDALIRRSNSLCGSTLSLLVNNAATFPEGMLHEMSFRDLTGNIRVNAWTPLCLSRAFAKTVRSGSIVNLLDARIAGKDSGHAAYILSKLLLASLTRICALEFAPAVRVNGVAPGLILPPAGKTKAYLNALARKVPLRMHGEPGDVAQAVLFLARSAFVTGEVVFVDGGRHLLRDVSAR